MKLAKRFTDTNKYKEQFFRGLQGAYKLLWDYIKHDCDHAGIWIVDFEVTQIYLGNDMQVNKHDALKYFNKEATEIIVIEGGKKWFIPCFIEEQYGKLNPNNKVHNSVLFLLEKYKIEGYPSPLERAKDKDKDKDKDKVKDKVKDKNTKNSEEETDLSDPVTNDVKKQIDSIIKLSNELFPREGYNIDLEDWNARNVIGQRITEEGFQKVEIAVNQAEKDYYNDHKMFKMCQWEMLFRSTSIDKLYTVSQLSPPADKKQPGKSNGMPDEFK